MGTSTPTREYSIDISDFTGEEVSRLHEVIGGFLASRGRGRGASPVAAVRPALPAEFEPTGWTAGHVALLFKLLDEAGGTTQRSSIQFCDRDGFIPRRRIYDIGDYEPERRLNRWTVPVDSAVVKLKRGYGLPAGAVDPVTADYPETKSYSAARGYIVAAELCDIIHRWVPLWLPAEGLRAGDVIITGALTGHTVTGVDLEARKFGVKTLLGDEGEAITAPGAAWRVWREAGGNLVLDTESTDPQESIAFFRSESEVMGGDRVESAVLTRQIWPDVGLLLTFESGRQIGLIRCASGYRENGPEAIAEAAAKVLTEAGFHSPDVLSAVYPEGIPVEPVMLTRS